MIVLNVISLVRMNELIETLLSNSIEIINCDELSINSRQSKIYDWELNEERHVLWIKNLQKGNSLIVSISQYKYFGVMVSDKAFNPKINSKDSKIRLQKSMNIIHNSQYYILLWDNN